MLWVMLLSPKHPKSHKAITPFEKKKTLKTLFDGFLKNTKRPVRKIVTEANSGEIV